VPLYPVLPLVFCMACAYMLWSSLSYVGGNTFLGVNAAWVGVAVLASGVVLMWLVGQSARPAAGQAEGGT
jgi:hypothetical protein